MIFSDLGASDCAFTDRGPGVIQVHVFHMYTAGAKGSRFRLNVDGFGWTHLGDLPDFAETSGSTIDGSVICYQSCLTGNFKLLTANFFGSGLVPACSRIKVDAYPGGGVEALDCAWNVVNPGAGEGIINSDGSCDCTMCRPGVETLCAIKLAPEETIPSRFCATSPVDQSTWGIIKSLYD